jgi:hypothetical protein
LIDHWHARRAYEANRRDIIGRYVVREEEITERHRREIESKDSTIALQQLEQKVLLSMIETLQAKLSSVQAALALQQAQSENAVRRPPQAGGTAN